MTVFSQSSIPRGLLSEAPALGTKRYIVRFEDGATEETKKKEINDRAALVRQNLSASFNGAIVDMTTSQAALMRRSSKVLWVEEDKPVASQEVVSPTPSWGLDRIDQKTTKGDNTYAFATTGIGVDAYVVDTGLRFSHIEFSGRARPGYDAFNQGAVDCNGHGTHVAGTLAGSTYGIAPKASIVAVRVLGCSGEGTVSGVIAGIEWAILDHSTTPAVMNLSLNADESPSLESAVDRAFADGFTVVVAAGNSSIDACKQSPSGDKASALTVGATNINDVRDSYSNFGACLDLFAPGTGITSAGITTDASSQTLTGTSMASPHVAGLAARFLSSTPTASPSTVMSTIITSATPNRVADAGTLSPNLLAFAAPGDISSTSPTSPSTPSSSSPSTSSPITTTTPSTTIAPTTSPQQPGSNSPTGSGPISVPGKTSTPVSLAGDTSAWLTWGRANDGGSPLTSHVVRVYRKGQLQGQVVVDADTFHTIFELRPGSSHSFTVAAMNGIGVGEFSAPSNIVIPVKATGRFSAPQFSNLSSDKSPEAPRRIVTGRSGSSALVQWTPPTNAVVAFYEVQITRGGILLAKVVTTSTGGVKIFGLKRGTYSVRVLAVNSTGSSPKSTAKRIRI